MSEPCNCAQALALTAEVERLRAGASRALYLLSTSGGSPCADDLDETIESLERILGPPNGKYRCPRCGKIEDVEGDKTGD